MFVQAGHGFPPAFIHVASQNAAKILPVFRSLSQATADLQTGSHSMQLSCYRIGNVYRSATCQFSKSCGPVRYSPRSTRQPKKREQDEHTKSYQHDVEETYNHVPAMPSLAHRFQDPAESLHLGCDPTKQDGVTRAKRGFSLDEVNDFSSASTKTPHVFQSRGNGAKDPKRSSVNSAEVFEAYMNMQGMPINSLDVSQQSFPMLESVDSFQACGFLDEEEETTATMHSSKHAAEWRDKEPRPSQESSTDLAKFSIYTKMQARSDAGSIRVLENGLDIAAEKEQTFMELNVESETCPQAVISNPSLHIMGKHPMKREPDFQEGKHPMKREPNFQEGKQLPYQDVESFLLKVQKAKQRAREPLNKSHAATSIEGNLFLDDDFNERDDDNCLFLGQETLHEKDDGLVSNSKAAREHAKNQAIRYLAMRPYTAFQLRKKLESRNITSELADYAIATVQRCGLQSDLLFAETYSRARFNHGSWGPQRIKLGLQQRGISNEIIQVAIARVFSEEDIESEQDGTSENDTRSTSPEISRAAMDHLLVQATKQWNRGRNATNDTKVRRMVCWLQYRGFNYRVIKRVLSHLQQKICIDNE